MPLCVPQLSHDANETLPLHLYVKSYGKNIDSKLHGGGHGRVQWGAGGGTGGRCGDRWGLGRHGVTADGSSPRSDPLQLLLWPQRLQPVPGRSP